MITIERHNDGTPTDYGRQQLAEMRRAMESDASFAALRNQPTYDEIRDAAGVLISRTLRP